LDWRAPWILGSIAFYLLAMFCWLPVVWLQLRMAAMARAAVAAGTALPDRFWRFHRLWTALGIPAFAGFVAVFYLMVVKPA
jgi:uncharacterized membrane protein